MTPVRNRTARAVLMAYRQLLQGQPVSASSLTSTYDIKSRTARTWLDLLEELPEVRANYTSGQKVLERTGKWAWVSVAPELGVILALSKHILSPFAGTKFHRRFELLFEELEESNPEGSLFVRRQWAKFIVRGSSSHGTRIELEPVLEIILAALEREVEVSFEYITFEGRKNLRVVQPLSLVILGDELYLAARQDGQVKIFSLYGISGPEILSTPFEYPNINTYNPGELFRSGLGIWPAVDNEEVFKLSLRFDPRLKPWLNRHRWHPSQLNTNLDDGSVLIEMLLPWNPETRRFVLSFGHEVELLSPLHARKEIFECFKLGVRQYSRSK